ncbi:MAG: hypothetical protein FD161_1669 [Limisphaerales bacterium]|nr:MAG: hypothetical protein FD161_1669 [Limisphaerales bacterium]KAG0509278.1 MAG: hypothetical protein E1N63_1588 [Limisphaerales bacterium]TXT52184.1 MAG: hypothetical protein FD140_927 [Limisphaerales bacterium]
MKLRKPSRFDCVDRLLDVAIILVVGLVILGLFMPAYPARRPLPVVVVSAK